jgi:hypothetical protein
MVDAHQRSSLSALRFVELNFTDRSGRVGATGAWFSPQSAKGAVGGQNQGVDHFSSVYNRSWRGENGEIVREWQWVVELITSDKFV